MGPFSSDLKEKTKTKTKQKQKTNKKESEDPKVSIPLSMYSARVEGSL